MILSLPTRTSSRSDSLPCIACRRLRAACSWCRSIRSCSDSRHRRFCRATACCSTSARGSTSTPCARASRPVATAACRKSWSTASSRCAAVCSTSSRWAATCPTASTSSPNRSTASAPSTPSRNARSTMCNASAHDNEKNENNAHKETLRHDSERPLLPPAQAFFSPLDITERSARHALVSVDTLDAAHDADVFATAPPPPLPIIARTEHPAEALLKFIETFSGRVLFAAETPGRRETLLDVLKGNALHPAMCDGWRAFADGNAHLAITVAPLEQGLLMESPPLAVISEAQLFGEQAVQRRRRKTQRTRDADALIRDLTELNVGAPVVHEDHGVGRYLGMQTIEFGGITTEFITIEYAGGDKLYVPVSSLHLISRYSGDTAENAPLHKLGSDQWIKAKRRAAEKVRDVAAELLDIFARRAARKGHAFPEPDLHYRSFASTFPFEETPDQQATIDAVLSDMHRTQPMDRLVCGDVGFGKTEVAMRAAFMAVHNGRQVAVSVRICTSLR